MNAASCWSFDRRRNPHGVVSEVGVDSNAIAVEVSDLVVNFEAGEACVSIVRLGNIIGELTLVEVDFTVVAFPVDEVTKCVLCEETVRLDVVCIYFKTRSDVVLAIFNTATNIMVSSPQPRVVNDNILVVNLDHGLSRYFFL